MKKKRKSETDAELMAEFEAEAKRRGITVQRVAAEQLDKILLEQARRNLLKRLVKKLAKELEE